MTGEARDVTDDAGADAESGGGPGAAAPVGVKLGSTRTVVVAPDGNGGIEELRTLTCLASYEDLIDGEERLLFGDDAAAEFPDAARFVLRSGLPADDESADLAARFFEELLATTDVPSDSVVVYAIPTIDNPAGLRHLETVIEDSSIGDRLVRSYPESLCGSLPAFGDGQDALETTFLAVNMGATTLEVCVYRHGEQLLPHSTGSVTGDEVDRRIARNVEAETQGRVNVDLTTAREYKERHADLEDYEPFSDVVQQPGGGSHEFTVERGVMDAVDGYLDQVVEEVADAFLPRLASDSPRVHETVLDAPIVLTGGMACVPGTTETFEQRLGGSIDREVRAIRPDHPDLAAARGAHEIATSLADRL